MDSYTQNLPGISRKGRALARRWAAAAMILTLAVPAGATMMIKPVPLEGLAHSAARIVHGTVTAVRSGRDASGLPATWVTLRVTETLKGNAGAELVIKQFGVAAPQPDGTLTRIAGLPLYSTGEEVVLFLHADSKRGFTSPVGMGQGVYRIERSGARASVRQATPGGQSKGLDEFLAQVARHTTYTH